MIGFVKPCRRLSACYCSSFKSPSLIHPAFLKHHPKSHVNAAGITKHTIKIPIHICVPPSGMALTTHSGPTRPQVPMPAPIATFSRWNTQVATGPVMAAVSVGGIHINGCFMMFDI